VRIEDGRIADFATAMTGELFALLSKQSILRHSIGERSAVRADDPAFLAHVAHGLGGSGGLSRLFSVRAASLLNGADGAMSAAALSGLLIGAEIRGMSALIGATPRAVHIVASGALATLYERAFMLAGHSPLVCKGDELVKAGLMSAARLTFGPDARAAQ
jgi:2-dehydro-3-deoxygalactonokinase